MSTEWPFGRAEVEELLRDGELDRVPPSTSNAQTLIGKARQHLLSAASLAATDPEIGVDALHNANRKALEAVLLEQGLRVTRQGGHTACYVAAKAQIRVTERKIRPELYVYDVVRRLRHGGDYASYEVQITSEAITDNLSDSTDLVEICAQLVGKMPPFIPDAGR